MGVEYSYCSKWWSLKRQALKPLSAAEAYQRHEARQSYTVVAGDAEHPFCAIELAGKFVSVDFLDDLLRVYLTYEFVESGSQRLFLRFIRHREFRDDTDAVIRATHYAFEEDGEMHIVRRDRVEETEVEKTGQVSVAEHWEPYPEFGEYTSLCRLERHSSASVESCR